MTFQVLCTLLNDAKILIADKDADTWCQVGGIAREPCLTALWRKVMQWAHLSRTIRLFTIRRYDKTILMCAQKLTDAS